MITECPSCQTRFRVTVEQLAVAHGRVRCGACLAVFDGREAEVTEKPAAVGDDPVDVPLQDAESTESVDVLLQDAESTESVSATGAEVPSPTGELDAEAGAAVDRPTHAVVFAAAVAAALALLVVGVFVLQYDVYVQDPAFRNAYEIVGVDVPRYRALDAIEVANPSVDERLGAPEPLIVRLDLTNTASRYQRFPTLTVQFHREDGALLDEHRVEPVAYLPSRQSRRMSPNRTTPVALRLDDPGPDAARYSISLL